MIHPELAQAQPLSSKAYGMDGQASAGPMRGHPAGRIKHGRFKQVLRVLQLATWFNLWYVYGRALNVLKQGQSNLRDF